MKRIFYAGLLILITTLTAKSQVFTITGNVNDEQGIPIHNVFILDSKSTKATFTDSLGNFTLQLIPGSTIQLALAGHRDTLITLDKSITSPQITLAASKSGSSKEMQAQVKLTTNTQRSTTATSTDMSTVSTGGTISAIAHQKETAHGNRYMFDDFVRGYVVSPKNIVVYNEGYRFDYDKIGGVLLLTKDNNNVSEVDNEEIMTFSLFGTNDKLLTFEKVPAIDNAHYVQVLAEGDKYAIYKSIKTEFIKSNYVNAGITTHGNDYDEFDDEYTYYLMDIKTKQVQKITLKKNALKTAFAAEADKVNKFITDHSSDDIDDAYMQKLGTYMNN